MFNLTAEEKAFICGYIPQAETLAAQADINELMSEIDWLILSLLDKDYNATIKSVYAQRIYDKLLDY